MGFINDIFSLANDIKQPLEETKQAVDDIAGGLLGEAQGLTDDVKQVGQELTAAVEEPVNGIKEALGIENGDTPPNTDNKTS